MRAPIDTADGRPTTTAELNTVLGIVHRSGVLAGLESYLDHEVGRPRTLPFVAFLVAAQLNALHRHHRGHLVEIARILNALTETQRQRLGILRWDAAEAYDRVERLFVQLCQALDASDGAQTFANRIAAAAIPDEMRMSTSVAVDGTDVETWGALHGDAETVELDGEAVDTQLIEPVVRPRKRAARKARVFGFGPDGRKRYTKDPDARAGHRSATNSRPAGPYVGFELHLAVQARDVRWTNGIDKSTLGPEVPNVITAFSLAPAGTHRAKAIVNRLIDGQTRDVVWDPGYSLCRPETGYWPLAQAGVETTFTPVTHQRGTRPFAGDALLIDGTLFSGLLPAELRDLPMPPRGASEEDKLAYERAFNRRARWRYVRHAGADPDGATRWRCPFCAGLLRSRSFPKTMRRARTAPLVHLDSGTRCCGGILTAQASELPLWQRILPGTTAWRISMGRRQVVESVNAALKGTFVDLARGFLRIMGLTKATVLLGFTLAAFNLERIRSYRAKHRLHADDEADGDYPPVKVRRAKRRTGTWADLIDERGPEPPG